MKVILYNFLIIKVIIILTMDSSNNDAVRFDELQILVRFSLSHKGMECESK